MNETIPVVSNKTLSWKFSSDGWDLKEWILVKSPRSKHFGKWVQKKNCIQNEVPAGVSPECLENKRANDTYTSMVYARPFTGELLIAVTMEFTYRMAPIIVLAAELGQDDTGRPEYREHFEVCLYDKGVNIWHHFFKDGKLSSVRDAYADFSLKPNVPYTLEVAIKGKLMSVRVDGHEFGYTNNLLPAQSYVGIIGCEGVNRFYDMTVTQTSEH